VGTVWGWVGGSARRAAQQTILDKLIERSESRAIIPDASFLMGEGGGNFSAIEKAQIEEERIAH
jgi:hypothetical protein